MGLRDFCPLEGVGVEDEEEKRRKSPQWAFPSLTTKSSAQILPALRVAAIFHLDFVVQDFKITADIARPSRLVQVKNRLATG